MTCDPVLGRCVFGATSWVVVVGVKVLASVDEEEQVVGEELGGDARIGG